jgi:alkylation response protein AidB-like acyl-CoA dehydrogenase
VGDAWILSRDEAAADVPPSARLLPTARSSTTAGAGSVLISRRPLAQLPAQTAVRSTNTQIYEGTNQIQRVVMARQLLK